MAEMAVGDSVFKVRVCLYVKNGPEDVKGN